MKIKNLRIGTLLILGFSITGAFVIILGAVSFFQSKKIQEQTEILYDHSLQVRKAVDNIHINILKMRIETRNLAFAINPSDYDSALLKIEVAAARIYTQFDIIRTKYLGSNDDVENAYLAFVEWDTKRNEIIQLAKAGKIASFIEMGKDNGPAGLLREKMVKKIDKLDNDVYNDSTYIYQNSIRYKDNLNLAMICILGVVILIEVLIITLLMKQIRKPIDELTFIARNLKGGNYNIRAVNIPENEFGVLSDAFNSLAEQLQSQIEIQGMEVHLAEIMLREDDEKKFFDNMLPVLAKYTNSQLIGVYLLSDDKKKLNHFKSIGTDEQARMSFDVESYEGELGIALHSKKIQSIKNIPLDTKFIFNTTSGKLIPREILTIPIISGNEVTAIISMASIRNFSSLSSDLIEKIYDTLNARIVGILTLMKLKANTRLLLSASEYNKNLIDASVDPFMTIDSRGKINDVNIAAENITGIRRENLIGTDFVNYFTQADKAKEVYQQVFKEGFVRNFELYIKHIDGKRIPVLYNATLYRDVESNEQRVFATARDVTETKRIENELIRLNEYLTQRTEELKKLNAELEHQKTALSNQSIELSQQNSLLELQKLQLDEANKLKSNFLSNMSHELRTPLNSVIALSGVLNRRLADKIPDEEYSFLSVIERNGKNLLGLINDILDISRIEAGKVEFEIEQFNLSKLIFETIYLIKPQADIKNIAINFIGSDDTMVVSTDASKCSHILQNLISNAVKFTEQGSVTVELSHDGDHIKVIVSDTGIGIAQEHIQHIFDEFRQADSGTARRYGGTGLGLSIAQKYANLLGGNILVESEQGKGSTFTLILPANFDADFTEYPQQYVQEKTNRIKNYSDEQSRKTILIVEDSEPIIVQLNDFLTESNFNALVARGGQESLELLKSTVPDAIILDLMMPGMDGFSVLKAIREYEPTENVPVLILTAKSITKEELSFLKKNHIYQLVQKGEINKTDFLNLITEMTC